MASFYKVRDVQKRLTKLGNKEHAAISQRFFKTGPGEYGQGDIFIGIRVPVLRTLAEEYKDFPASRDSRTGPGIWDLSGRFGIGVWGFRILPAGFLGGAD